MQLLNTKWFVRQASLVALASAAMGASGLAQAQTITAEAAQQALVAQMGNDAKDLQVTLIDGTARLSGWTKGPREVNQARYLVSQLPGVLHAYSSGVNTWVTTDH